MPGTTFPAEQATVRLALLRPVPARTGWQHIISPACVWIAVALIASAFLPERSRDLLALGAIILLGVPHGALDGELARTVLRPRFRHWWFVVFSLPYLALSAGVLVSWRWQPEPLLALFLAASALHFGREETGSTDPVRILAAGGAPIALTVLSHPLATARIFGVIARLPLTHPPVWLHAAALLWIVAASIAVVRLGQSRDVAGLVRMAMIAATAILLPPLTAFALYFVCIHAPAHVDGLIRDRRLAPRIIDEASAVRLSLGVTLLTLLIGVLLWPLYDGSVVPRLLCLTIQGLAALTLPHMLLEGWLRRRGAG